MRPLILLGGLDRREAKRRRKDLLRAVSLPESYFDRLPHELCGGEKQRVAIARAFAAEPELILCDEPISSLDVSVQGSLMNLLMQLQVEKKTSYVFISHDLSAVQHLSDAIAVVYLGHVMEIGDAARCSRRRSTPTPRRCCRPCPWPTRTSSRSPSGLAGRPERHGGTVRLPLPSALPTLPRRHLREQEPPWREGEGDHRVYCHIPLDELAGLQAETLVIATEGGRLMCLRPQASRLHGPHRVLASIIIFWATTVLPGDVATMVLGRYATEQAKDDAARGARVSTGRCRAVRQLARQLRARRLGHLGQHGTESSGPSCSSACATR